MRRISKYAAASDGSVRHCLLPLYCFKGGAGLQTPITHHSLIVEMMRALRPPSPRLLEMFICTMKKWNGPKLNQQVREIRKVNACGGVASSGICYPRRKVTQPMWCVWQKPSVRMRECDERQKVRTCVLMIIRSADVSYRCATRWKYSPLFFLISLRLLLLPLLPAGFPQSIGCPRHA